MNPEDNYNYPLLELVKEHFYKVSKADMENVYILACQHILSPQFRMFKMISDFGVPKSNIFILGKIYSTSNEVVSEMIDDGFSCVQPKFDGSLSFDESHSVNCNNLFHNSLSKIKNPSKIIILDDGGELLRIVNDEFFSISNCEIVGIEQTSSGFRKLENTKLNFPVYNVARSNIKLTKESPIIADIGVRRICKAISDYKIYNPRIIIFGLGPLGENVKAILDKAGYLTFGYDNSIHGEQSLIDLIINNKVNIVIGVTGTNILSEEMIQEIQNKVDDNLYLISMSSADREFPAVYIRNNGLKSDAIHADVTMDKIILINNGFPITFKGMRFESTPQEIERTIALLLGSVFDAVINTREEIGFINLPSELSSIINNFNDR